MEIIIPSLKEKNTLSFIKNLSDIETSNENEIVFCFDAEWVKPLGMALCCSAVKQFSFKNEEIPMRMELHNCNASGYASHMGFFRTISESIAIGNSPGEASGSQTYVPLTIIDLKDLQRRAFREGIVGEMNDIINIKSNQLASILCRSNNNMQQLFSYIIREILRNIPEHAETQEAIICAQYWPKNGKAEIAILDEGIGIKRSLRKNKMHREYINTDTDALISAVKPGISQAFSPDKKNMSRDVWANSGFGLFMASEICKRLNGEFWMISGEKAIQVNSAGITEHNTYFEGTAIGIEFDISKLDNTQEMIDEIVAAGEKEAKSIRNAFAHASEPSRSLFE